jgi:NAD(P)-dependent dehydrogenase (short-subunit alcohol dehydrogenase family)
MRSLSMNLVEKGIRVSAVAPGPIWAPLIPSTFLPEKVVRHAEEATQPARRSRQ